MNKSRSCLSLLLLLLVFTEIGTSQNCKICSKCTSCSEQIKNDQYIDDIHASIVEQVGEDIGIPLKV
jgi:hypothetical protein